MLFITSCANLDFVYKSIDKQNKLKNNTDFVINGDESDEISTTT